ncbi:hypothetical protein BD324DRAFT_286404 [Kockovaella imperatae]|uniref:Uncharacterized protein n=1 Tax=Kockovaella imperatae TaxID=4999 RepID=A0A1Y1U5R2_9TREE|nr:hypothetical protein BD324DRAFT_286404 [Kockovaella imperatae]ORX33332.1 hypothetical protein BD324DRAFT_286404 [Kockovaella imperatae]
MGGLAKYHEPNSRQGAWKRTKLHSLPMLIALQIIDLVLAVPACIPLLERADADPGALNLLQKLRDCTTHRMFSERPQLLQATGFRLASFRSHSQILFRSSSPF